MSCHILSDKNTNNYEMFQILTVDGWHDLDNTEYDCWPIVEPNDYNMISCGGKCVFLR